MSTCGDCGKEIDALSGFKCDHCGGRYCPDHRLPEKHSCHELSTAARRSVTIQGQDQSGGATGTVAVLIAFVVAGIVFVGLIVGAGALLFDAASSSGVSGGGIADVGGGMIDAAGGLLAGATPDTSLNETKTEQLVHEEINDVRESQGLSEVDYHDGVANGAEAHSEYLASSGVFSHETLDGEGPRDRYPRSCATVGENIAQTRWHTQIHGEGGDGELTSERELAKSVVNQWMNSEGHRENIVREGWTSEGIGVVITGDDEVYVTQGFCQT